MREQISKIFGSFSAFWKAQEKKRKILYLSIIGGIILLAVVIAVILNIPKYTVLYSKMDKQEAQEVVAQINALGVKYQLSDGDTTISVPESDIASAAMQLSEKGYPKSTLNYDIYTDNVGMFTTNSERREYARMATENRLKASIQTVQGVDSVIVNLAIPEQRDAVLNDSTKAPSASVQIALLPDIVLTDKQINGIRRLVSTAVPGLIEENVTLTDGTGSLLEAGSSDLTDATSLAVDRNRYRFQQSMEAAMRESVLSLLIPAFGEDGVNAAVNVRLNYDKRLGEQTLYTPSHDDGSGMVQHEDINNASGSNTAVGGVVGTDPNAEEVYPTEDGTEGGVWSKNSSSTSYLVNTLKEQTEKSGYTYESVNIGVTIYQDILPVDQIANITTTLARALGINEANVSVITLPKAVDNNTVMASGYPFNMTQMQFYMIMTVLLILIIMFSIMYVSVSKKARRKRRSLEQAIYEAAQAAGEQGMVRGYFHADGFGAPGAEEDVQSLNDNTNNESHEEAVRREIGEFADTSPDIVASLIHSMLVEDEENNGSRR